MAPKPTILTVDDDPAVSRAITRDLRSQYGADYQIVRAPSGAEAPPVLDELLSDWRREHPAELWGVRVVGHRWSERSHEVKTFLARNHVPYSWFDVERDAEARRLQDAAGASVIDLPLVLVPDGEPLRAPSTLELADALGLRTHASSRCTTSASWAPDRPVWPPRCTPRRRVCRRS